MSDLKRRLWNLSIFEKNFSPDKNLFLGLFLLWVISCLIALWGLGEVPLRDFDEATVARVALELNEKTKEEFLLPTLWQSPYLNKPPGIHWIISLIIDLNGGVDNHLPSEFSLRLGPALISTLVVPLGGLIQWQLRPRDHIASISTSVILLTLMPISRHGRLAMLDGPQLTAIALLWLMLLAIDGTRMDRWRALLAGLASSSMLLMKAPLLLPAICAAGLPIVWRGELRNYFRRPVVFWVCIGLLPGCAWHLWNAIHRGSGAFWLWWGDGAGRVLFYPGSGSDLAWRVPLIELVEGGWPWLLLLPIAISWAWKERHSQWGSWVLGTQLVFVLTIFPLKTQLPWYSHPLWLPFALLCGVPLSWLIRRERQISFPGKIILKLIPFIWVGLGLVLFLCGLLGFYEVINAFIPYAYIAIAAGTGWGLGGLLLNRLLVGTRALGLTIMVVGSLASLLFLMGSSFWLWELNEHWSVLPLAELLGRSSASEIAIDEPFERPSLNWYAKKRIRTLQSFPDAKWIVTQNPEEILKLIHNRKCRSISNQGEWNLLFCTN